MTAVALTLLWYFSKTYSVFRFRYLTAPRFERFTVMFSDIPHGIDSDVLTKYFLELAADSVVCVQIVKVCGHLGVHIYEGLVVLICTSVVFR